MAAEGHVLAEHLSSSIGFAQHDLGFTSDWKHDRYQSYAPAGYELEWVDDRKTHGGWLAAFELNKQLAPKEEQDADVTPRVAIEIAMTDDVELKDALIAEKQQLIAYLLVKVKAGDWHACADAAMDLREIEAQLKVINAP